MNLARTLAWPLLVTSLLIAAPAAAQIKLLVLEPESPFLKPGQLAELHGTLQAKAADYPDLELVDAPGLDGLKTQAGCKDDTPKCLAAAGRLVGAEQILVTRIQKLPGRQMLTFQLLDTTSGRQLKQVRQRARGGMPALTRTTRQGWVKLFGLRVDCRVAVTANVEDAQVSLDGNAIGPVPVTIRRTLRVGRHTVRVRHRDYLLAEKKFRAKARSCRAKLTFNLKLKGDDIAPVALVGPAVGSKIKDDEPGPGGKLKDNGLEPGGKLKDDGLEPGEKLKDDGLEPGGKLEDDGPGPGTKLKDDDPAPVVKVADPKLKDDGGQTGSIAGPLFRRKPVTKKPVIEKPFLPKDKAPDPEPDEGVPVYEKWWFWTAIGAVALAGAVTGTAIGLSGDGDKSHPAKAG